MHVFRTNPLEILTLEDFPGIREEWHVLQIPGYKFNLGLIPCLFPKLNMDLATES